uniref:Uncharacterized protein n=1 Tax=Romanomermis culicivorax TaxID=13658 RepID=A0A915HQH4_ROMCU
FFKRKSENFKKVLAQQTVSHKHSKKNRLQKTFTHRISFKTIGQICAKFKIQYKNLVIGPFTLKWHMTRNYGVNNVMLKTYFLLSIFGTINQTTDSFEWTNIVK